MCAKEEGRIESSQLRNIQEYSIVVIRIRQRNKSRRRK
jgi:hypothetical protein